GGGGGRTALLQQQPSSAPPAAGSGGDGGTAVAVSGTGWGRNALLNRFANMEGNPGAAAAGGNGGGGFGRSSLLAAASVPAPLSPALSAAVAAAAPAAPGGGWGRRSILASQGVSTPPPPQPPPPPHSVHPPSSADAARMLRQPSSGGRHALIADLMADGDDGGRGGMYAPHSYRGRSPQRGSLGGKARSQSVGGIGRPNGGSRGGISDRVAKLDAGSWIYILGASASSTRAKTLASALQLDPRTGLPAL
ncbi:hypothetical protein Vafri_7398, partial [Volvox africanus]